MRDLGSFWVGALLFTQSVTDRGMFGYLSFSFVSIGSVYFKKLTFSLSFKILAKSLLYHVFTVYGAQKSSGDGPCVWESSNLYLWFLVVVLAVDLLIFVVVVPFKDQFH